ncbi:MAG TPA: UMP kinase [Gemmataceae bacterium]|jgi:uridylate kinase|nr:UMP kinase [Gemmataceae bacterium]
MDDSHSSDSLRPKYRRVVLKLSGESFGPSGKIGISLDETLSIARQAKRVVERGVELAIVVGGGNLIRGAQFAAGSKIIRDVTADHMGMLATVMNALTLQDALESIDCETRVQSAIEMNTVCEPYIRRRCIRHLEKGRVVILAGGTGNPFVTTDTAAALRAREIEAAILLKATKVDGVYSAPPEINPHAVRYEKLTYEQVIKDNLRVMDISAIEMCQKINLPILVFEFKREGNIERAIAGQTIGTVIWSAEAFAKPTV